MPEGWNGAERRRHPRVAVEGEVRGRIHTVASAPIINLSLSGALLEVPCTLRVGAVYTMRLAVGSEKVVDVKAKVVRSYVHGFDKNEKGETVIKYRAAVQFHGMREDQQVLLQRFIEKTGSVSLHADLHANPPLSNRS